MASVRSLTADEIIARLGMRPHPEGGWFVETFRDPLGLAGEATETGAGTATGRAASTAIYFLLAEGQISDWHTVDAVEIWHWHAGSPLALSIAATDDSPPTTRILGADLAAGERPQGIVPRHAWQSARSLGPWTLVGCTVAPGFDYAGFTLAPAGWAPGPR